MKVFWLWILNALVHSVLLFWLPLLTYGGGIVWDNGRHGGYLVLGNMVYTVNITYTFYSIINLIHLRNCLFPFQVCCGNGMFEGWHYNKLMDVADALFNMGINSSLVIFHIYIQ